MLTILEYPIEPDALTNVLEIEMPKGAKVLGARHGDPPVMWAAVDTKAPSVTRKFRLCETATNIESDVALSLTYIDTITFPSGFSFHLFEEIEGLSASGPDNLYTMLEVQQGPSERE